jgi:hypothetical protein
MAIKEKLSRDEIILYDILKHPVLGPEFIYNLDRMEYEKEFKFDYYQNEMLCDFNRYVAISCARAIGKTVVLVALIVWLMTNNFFPKDYIVYTVPNKAQLEPVWTGLTRQFRTNSFLKQFLEHNKGINSSEHSVKLLNGSALICRIAGTTGTGANVIGLHTPFEILDESGYYPWGTWLELQPTLNTWQDGFRLITSGVPTGLREQNVCYHTDMVDGAFTKHRISAYENPRFTEQDEKQAIKNYGGKDSEDFAHLVLGKHGSPIFAVFDRRLFDIGNYEIYQLKINGIKMTGGLQEYITKLSFLPSMPKNNNGIIMGVDLGYTDPTAIILMYIDTEGKFRFHSRIQLSKVSYNLQDRIIDLIDTRYSPDLIGVDEGHSGKAVTQRLRESEDFSHKDYNKRLLPINFSSSVVIGEDLDGKEITSRTKPFSVSVLQDYVNSHKIKFSSTDPELMTELERMTYSKNTAGDITYRTLTPKGGKKGDDHFTAALLCGTLAYYIENESFAPKREKKKLMGARWF